MRHVTGVIVQYEAFPGSLPPATPCAAAGEVQGPILSKLSTGRGRGGGTVEAMRVRTPRFD